MTLLAQPLPLPNGRVLSNRLAKSAMSERIAGPDGAPNAGHAHLYGRWGEGGASLLITGNVMVERTALGESGNVFIEDESALDAFRVWASSAKNAGAQIWMQINHPGRQSPRHLSKQPVAPSAVRLVGAGPMFATPRALTEEQILEIIERFANAAAIAEAAGFDGVQIHGAHGYLISQFLSPRTNLRTDRWGGDAERRRRFLIEVIRAVRMRVGRRFCVGLKLNSADFQRGGFSEEESMGVVRSLQGLRLDLLEISGGTYESAAMFDEPKPESTKRREAFFLAYAEKVRTETTIPLMVTGGFRSAEGMGNAVESGAVDVVGLARPMAVEPGFPMRVLADDTAVATPVKLATGIRNLDSLVQGAWYQLQIERMARGQEPNPAASRWWAVLKYFLPRAKFASPAAVMNSPRRADPSRQATV